MQHVRYSSMTLALTAALALFGCGQKEEAKPEAAAAPAPAAAPALPWACAIASDGLRLASETGSHAGFFVPAKV